jgi:competence protein ComFC
MLSIFLDLLFPRVCIGCGRSGTTLCAICERTIVSQPTTLPDGTAALFDYRNPLVKKIIWRLKFHADRAMGTYLGVALYREFFRDLLSLPDHQRMPIVLVPIPLSRRKMFRKPFNHAEVIARTIEEYALADSLPVVVNTHILQKVRETKSQVETIGKEERIANIANAFRAEISQKERDSTFVVIDDVVTTGATMREAKRALREAGARRVLCLAVAH